MKLKLARKDLKSSPREIDIEEIEKRVEESNGEIFYFDRENSHKDLVALVEHFENLNKAVYLREAKYGFDEEDYVYEVHIL